ncbi:DNA processing protein [Psychromicrobium silvestre]|uniref:DNA processing protein n=1 Tax=Psychromicrobium silvestre TaxID=1645614 RepID=A0A7Y9S6H1_9MICC|nr:DNA-processing protein DprA [Psychromicrobium silvestre]NYE94596.1 DNA processing protein [Psychromicrobium silvestre]
MDELNPRIARAALSRLMEPSDLQGMALLKILGPVQTLAVAVGRIRLDAESERAVAELLDEETALEWRGLEDCLARWRPRLADLAPERDLGVMQRLGGGLMIPEDAAWPRALSDLALTEPIGLWYRSAAMAADRLIPQLEDCIAVVGSRDSTRYGESVTAELVHGLAGSGKTILSGGAYGIDAAAHRAALQRQSGMQPGVQPGGWLPTIAVMAGGLDRFYPSGNEGLLREVAARGILLAEVPPGSNPTRYRFLQRNRLIAALSCATVVVEARWRSGALNTAHHALGLGRAMAAVPGSVYSANSAGCHRLLREGAQCVSDAAEILELVLPIGSMAGERSTESRETDGLSPQDLMLLDALPLRSEAVVEKLSAVAGLQEGAVRAGLGRLEVLGLAKRGTEGWLRSHRRSGVSDRH